MARKGRGKSGKLQQAVDVAGRNFARGLDLISRHPMFAPLMAHARVARHEGNLCPADGWAVVTSNGIIHAHPTRRGEAEEWVYVLAHCLLHLGFGHFPPHDPAREWNAACDCFIAKFQADLKLGRPPEELRYDVEFSSASEERLHREFSERGIPGHLSGFGTAGHHHSDMIFEAVRPSLWGHRVDWQDCFGKGLAMAVTSAVNVAAGREPYLGADRRASTPAQDARTWFINSYPLLGALAAAFDIIEDPLLCARMDISVAAVDAVSREIYLNPAAGLDESECRFVMAHEILHVGLRHQMRCQGREPYLWNVACDYVINGWLVEMGLGKLPAVGALYDPELKGLSAEAIYDRIVHDLRRFRKLATLGGTGAGDMLAGGRPDWWAAGDGMALDDFYRRALGQGLAYHEEQGRGFLPGGLVEEIRALSQPPIPWDVELAQWFDNYFSPLEKVRSYARPSRRQSATPDIARPRWVPAAGAEDGRTFGVVLDTSGSMDRQLLAKALGSIASYSISRDVPAVRVVFCDAVTYDQGYMSPEAIGERVRVRGRGGTILQPGIDLLEKAEDFPDNGPLLIITDGFCDRLRIRNPHSFLLPRGRHLPFVPKGQVFSIV
jgi:predicted metal-dependent peptidase